LNAICGVPDAAWQLNSRAARESVVAKVRNRLEVSSERVAGKLLVTAWAEVVLQQVFRNFGHGIDLVDFVIEQTLSIEPFERLMQLGQGIEIRLPPLIGLRVRDALDLESDSVSALFGGIDQLSTAVAGVVNHPSFPRKR